MGIILILRCFLPMWKKALRRKVQNMKRRTFLAGCGSVFAARSVPVMMKPSGGRRVLTLVYDQSLGMMRAIDRLVP